MANKYYRYGQLNPAVHPNRGRTLDPTTTSGIESLARNVAADKTPRFLDKLRGPLRGIVIEDFEKQANKDKNWFERLFSFGEESGLVNRIAYRVRIPEIHAHLPEPGIIGEGGSQSILGMYPIFTAIDPNAEPASVGSVVYVDFMDRERFLDPVYLGPVANRAEAGGHDLGEERTSRATTRVNTSLAAAPASGDSQTPTVVAMATPRPRPSIDDIVPPNTAYSLPVDEPAVITSAYGRRKAPVAGASTQHLGLDLAARVGDPLYAIDDGYVTRTFFSRGGGNIVLIYHGKKNGKKLYSQYLHMNKVEVAQGDTVKSGDKIGEAGKTGNVSGPHLHLDILVNGVKVDPAPYIAAASGE